MREDYIQTAKEARIKVLDLIHKAQTSHIGSNFSCIDILTVLFDKIDLDKDVFVMSAGWKAASLYYFLWKKGRITEEQLNSYCQEGSEFIGLAEPIVPDIKIAGGSMGLSFPGAVGIAMAKKLKGEEGKVYVLMSDGELAIGTTWESALIASQHNLDNLVVIVDRNGLQAMGATNEILDADFPSIYGKGWNFSSIDGHNFDSIERALETEHESPLVISATTTKGKGWKKAENNNLYHYLHVTDEDYQEALAELNG